MNIYPTKAPIGFHYQKKCKECGTPFNAKFKSVAYCDFCAEIQPTLEKAVQDSPEENNESSIEQSRLRPIRKLYQKPSALQRNTVHRRKDGKGLRLPIDRKNPSAKTMGGKKSKNKSRGCARCQKRESKSSKKRGNTSRTVNPPTKKVKKR